MRRLPRSWAVWGLPWLAAAGFLDALYLSVEHYLHRVPPCSIVTGCETVLTSRYATLLGIPVALWGALYYLVVFTLSVKLKNQPHFITLLILIVSVGLVISGVLLYLQAAVLQAYCLFCLISATVTLFIFLTTIRIAATRTTKETDHALQ